MSKNSEILSKMIGMLYPFIIILGFYVILNGHNTPGGGFQGGAILSAVFITRYLILPVEDVRIKQLQTIEKFVFIMILTLPALFLLTLFHYQYPSFNLYYMVLMNVLIGIKVCCGLSIIFFRFVFYEGR